MPESVQPRAFKTAWFTKAAKRAKIGDAELRKAIQQVMAGQADDLGGGVYKKRLSNNDYRSIVLARGGNWWVYEFLFAKQDQANIAEDDLRDLRNIAKAYAAMTEEQAGIQIAKGDWIDLLIDQQEPEK